MERPHIITIAGKPGSGKSSTAHEVAKLLHYEYISAGKMVRQIAKENGMSLAEANELAEKNPAMDRKIDEYIREIGKRSNIVVDSRLGFHWIPDSFKVFLALDSDIAIARIYRDIEKNERRGEHAESFEEVWEQLQERTQAERSRFMKLYGVNPFAEKHYDLIIHTERNNPMTVSLWIHDQYQKWLRTRDWRQVTERVPLGYSEQ